MRLANWGRELARSVLAAEHPVQWEHTKLVAMRTEVIGRAVLSEEEREVLCAAAWMHRTGTNVELRDTGFVPLDSARYIASRTALPVRVAALVAHQSSAATTAVQRRLTGAMAEFADEATFTRDVLWYCSAPEDLEREAAVHNTRQTALKNVLGTNHAMVYAHAEGLRRRREAAARVMQVLEASNFH